MRIVCTRKEDKIYYQGPFWIISDSFQNIIKGNFEIIGEKYECNYSGEYLNNTTSKRQKTHKSLWRMFADKYGQSDYTYYPRGRVGIYNGIAYIHINSRCNLPKIIDTIIEQYHLSKLEINVELNDTYQGSHYDFKLK